MPVIAYLHKPIFCLVRIKQTVSDLAWVDGLAIGVVDGSVVCFVYLHFIRHPSFGHDHVKALHLSHSHFSLTLNLNPLSSASLAIFIQIGYVCENKYSSTFDAPPYTAAVYSDG